MGCVCFLEWNLELSVKLKALSSFTTHNNTMGLELAGTNNKKSSTKSKSSSSKPKSKASKSATASATKSGVKAKGKGKAKASSTTIKRRRAGVLDELLSDLPPARRREVNHISLRCVRNDILTPAFITASLRGHTLATEKMEQMPAYILAAEHVRDEALTKIAAESKEEDKESKSKRIRDQCDQKLKRFASIQSSFESGSRAALKEADLVFLSKTKLPKPLSGYMLFAKDKRPVIKAEFPEADFGEIGQKIGSIWKELSQEERDSWKAKAKATEAA